MFEKGPGFHLMKGGETWESSQTRPILSDWRHTSIFVLCSIGSQLICLFRDSLCLTHVSCCIFFFLHFSYPSVDLNSMKRTLISQLLSHLKCRIDSPLPGHVGLGGSTNIEKCQSFALSLIFSPHLIDLEKLTGFQPQPCHYLNM